MFTGLPRSSSLFFSKYTLLPPSSSRVKIIHFSKYLSFKSIKKNKLRKKKLHDGKGHIWSMKEDFKTLRLITK